MACNASTSAVLLVYCAYLSWNSRYLSTEMGSLIDKVIWPDARLSPASRVVFDREREHLLRFTSSWMAVAVAVSRAASFLYWKQIHPLELVSDNIWSDVVLAPFTVFLVMFQFFPRWLTVRRWNALILATASGFAAEKFMNVHHAAHVEVAFVIFRLAACISLCDPRLALAVNATVSSATAFQYLFRSAHPMFHSARSGILAEITCFVFSTVLASGFVFCAARTAELQEGLTAALKAQPPLRSLLARWCDATVELGGDLRLREHSDSFAALLRRRSLLRGAHFGDFVLRSDKGRFEQILEAHEETPEGCENASPAQVVRLSLVDGDGRPVPVQLVHTCIRDSFNGDAHFLGICEDDVEFHQVPARASDSMLSRQAWDKALRSKGIVVSDGSADWSDDDWHLNQDACSSTTGDSTTVSSCSVFSSVGFADVAIVVDASYAKLRILEASAAFMELGGSETIGSTFANWVADRKRFTAWVQQVTRALKLNCLPDVCEYTGGLRFKVLQGTCHASAVRPDVSHFRMQQLQRAQSPALKNIWVSPEEIDDLDSIPLRLEFIGLQKARHRTFEQNDSRKPSELLRELMVSV